MENHQKGIETFDSSVIRKIFPKLKGMAECILSTLADAIISELLKEFSVQSNYFAITYFRQDKDHMHEIELGYFAEIVDALVKDDNVSAKSIYSVYVMGAIDFTGSSDVLECLMSRIEKYVKSQGLEYWKSIASKRLQAKKEEVEVLQEEIHKFYKI